MVLLSLYTLLVKLIKKARIFIIIFKITTKCLIIMLIIFVICCSRICLTGHIQVLKNNIMQEVVGFWINLKFKYQLFKKNLKQLKTLHFSTRRYLTKFLKILVILFKFCNMIVGIIFNYKFTQNDHIKILQSTISLYCLLSSQMETTYIGVPFLHNSF